MMQELPCQQQALTHTPTHSEQLGWHKCRQETPGCKHVVHLNNAGAALQPQCVIDAVQQYIAEESVYGGYETASRCSQDLRRPYVALAQLLNCDPDEIAIVSSATSAWGQVFFGIPFQRGDVILTVSSEYGSNYLAYLQAQKRCGVCIQVIPETSEGDIDLPALHSLLHQQPKPALLSLSHVPTSSGKVYDVEAAGRAAAAAGVPFLLDACQSAGQMPLDVQLIKCDFLTGTSRKYFRGPRGIGFLYARKQCTRRTQANDHVDHVQSIGKQLLTGGWEPSMIDIHAARWVTADAYRLLDSAERYEQYEVNFAAKVGFGCAVEYCLQQGIQGCWQHTQQLAQHLRQRLAVDVPGVTIHDRGRHLCGIVSFTIDRHPADCVKSWLSSQQPPINVSVSSINSTRLDFEQRGLTNVVRASVSYYNDDKDIAALISALRELVCSGLHGALGTAAPSDSSGQSPLNDVQHAKRDQLRVGG